MQFSLESKTATLSVGEFAGFTLGPHETGGGLSGLWRAQLGQHWHNELRTRTLADAPDARFEVPIEGGLVHRGWTLTLSGRIDQILGVTLREIKTVTRPLPAPEPELRADYPAYFIQLGAYLALLRTSPFESEISNCKSAVLRGELVFVEAGSGLSQPVTLTPADESLFHRQLDLLVEFLDLRLRATARRRSLVFRPAFADLRPGQETIQQDLANVFADASFSSQSEIQDPKSKILLLEAPTGYGKTGCVLEFALGQLRAGRFGRLIWLTGKATGQLQVMRILAAMTGGSEPWSPHLGGQALAAFGAAVGGQALAPPLADKLARDNPSPLTAHRSLAATPVAAWQVRPKSEHCINHTFHCVRDACGFLDGCAARWSQSGLARFYLDESHPHDLATLRAAGQDARICPYEITRASLPFHDVWLGDYNYIFAPDNRGLFYEQPGFDPSETLLVIDEAHNLPARVADAHSHIVRADDAQALLTELHRLRPLASLLLAWENWTRLLARLRATDALNPAQEREVCDALEQLSSSVATVPIDHATLGPRFSEMLWRTPQLAAFLADASIEKLLWSPRIGELHFTCLDAAPLIGETLRAFGGVILMSATLRPEQAMIAACGLDEVGRGSPPAVVPRLPDEGWGPAEPPVSRLTQTVRPAAPDRLGALNKRQTRKLYRQLTTGADLLRVEESRDSFLPRFLHAPAPWRDGAYDVAIDLRVATTLRARASHYAATAATIEALHSSLSLNPFSLATRSVTIFFPSYAYAEAILRALEEAGSLLCVALQPRLPDLAAQTAWVEESLASADALFLVLGSSFAEGIDLLGGRVTHAMVVGPALPEVNAVQRARLAALEHDGLNRDAAFRRVYQISGMTKVNQALGRLVRAPGQRAKVLLHCRRFAEPSYASLLAPEYQPARELATSADLAAWLKTDA